MVSTKGCFLLKFMAALEDAFANSRTRGICCTPFPMLRQLDGFMAVFHIVWLKFRPDVTGERIAEHLRALNRLPRKVPEIAGFSIGKNFTDRAAGFTDGLIVELRDRDDLQRYIENQYHADVASALREDAELLAMDYET